MKQPDARRRSRESDVSPGAQGKLPEAPATVAGHWSPPPEPSLRKPALAGRAHTRRAPGRRARRRAGRPVGSSPYRRRTAPAAPPLGPGRIPAAPGPVPACGGTDGTWVVYRSCPDRAGPVHRLASVAPPIRHRQRPARRDPGAVASRPGPPWSRLRLKPAAVRCARCRLRRCRAQAATAAPPIAISHVPRLKKLPSDATPAAEAMKPPNGRRGCPRQACRGRPRARADLSVLHSRSPIAASGGIGAGM
jgi:hypothetical protein